MFLLLDDQKNPIKAYASIELAEEVREMLREVTGKSFFLREVKSEPEPFILSGAALVIKKEGYEFDVLSYYSTPQEADFCKYKINQYFESEAELFAVRFVE